MDCIFCKIGNRIIPKEFTYEDKDIMVFPDIHPLRKVHLLIIPKKHIEDFMKLEDEKLMTKLIKVTQKMVKKEKLEDKGYRIVINGGGAQIVQHLHIHLMGPVGITAKM
jgi:histidine triad (HIT) family protein